MNKMKLVINILLGVLLVISGVLIFYLFREKNDHTVYIVQLERIVNGVLDKNNVKDRYIIKQQRAEKQKGLHRWLEFDKEIRLPVGISVNKIKESLSRALVGLDYRVELYRSGEESALIKISREDKLLVNMLFRLPRKIRIALVIDDVGYENKRIKRFLALGIPITFSILPKERCSMQIAKILAEKKMPYLLHLPLEPEGYPEKNNPGKDAILVSMNNDEVKSKFLENLASVGNPVGVNNHMGSVFTKRSKNMRYLLKAIKDKNLFFFDSKTTPKTVARKVAKETGTKFLANDIFLDGEDSPESINLRFIQLLNIAQKRGYAITIAHIHKIYVIRVLEELAPELTDGGVEFIYLTDLLEKEAAKDKKINVNPGN